MNWNDLSLSKKRDLMKVYIDSGIKDLDLMRAHYNSNSDSSTLQDLNSSRPLTVTPLNNKFGDGGDFINEWNNKRLSTGRYDSLLGNGELQKLLDNRESVKVYKSSRAYATNLAKSKLHNQNDPSYPLNLSKASSIINSRFTIPDLYGNIVLGEYNPDTHSIYASPLDSTIITHELSHASKATPQELVIKGIIQGDNTTNTSYYDRPTEVYSRLMLLRLANSLSPDSIYDKRSLKDLKKRSRDFNIFDRYSDDKVLRLLNEVASNSLIHRENWLNTLLS